MRKAKNAKRRRSLLSENELSPRQCPPVYICVPDKVTTRPVKKCCRRVGRRQICHPRFCGGSRPRPTTCRPPRCYAGKGCRYIRPVFKKGCKVSCGVKKCTTGPVKKCCRHTVSTRTTTLRLAIDHGCSTCHVLKAWSKKRNKHVPRVISGGMAQV